VTPASGDFLIAWQRRTRIGGAWLDGIGTVPLSEQSEAYDVEILDGFGRLVRTFAHLTTPQVLYTAAMQTTDFGAPVTAIRGNVYQLSANVGRGFQGRFGAPITNFLEIPLAPSAAGDLLCLTALLHSRLDLHSNDLGRAIWLRAPQADATSIYLTASDAGLTGIAVVWAQAVPSVNLSHRARQLLGPHGLSSRRRSIHPDDLGRHDLVSGYPLRRLESLSRGFGWGIT
jgi:hypothetical protein